MCLSTNVSRFWGTSCLWFILLHCQYLGCVVLDGRVTDYWWIGSGLEGSGHGLIEVLYRHLTGVGECLSQESQCPGWRSELNSSWVRVWSVTAVPSCLILPLRSETQHTHKVLLIGVQKTLKYQNSGMASDSGLFLWIFYTCRVHLKKYSYLILLYFQNLTVEK
jgi:hypothetical protein